MKSQILESIKDKQVKKIVKFQTLLQKKTHREIIFTEALINWLAVGMAKDYDKNMSLQRMPQ